MKDKKPKKKLKDMLTEKVGIVYNCMGEPRKYTIPMDDSLLAINNNCSNKLYRKNSKDGEKESCTIFIKTTLTDNINADFNKSKINKENTLEFHRVIKILRDLFSIYTNIWDTTLTSSGQSKSSRPNLLDVLTYHFTNTYGNNTKITNQRMKKFKECICNQKVYSSLLRVANRCGMGIINEEEDMLKDEWLFLFLQMRSRLYGQDNIRQGKRLHAGDEGDNIPLLSKNEQRRRRKVTKAVLNSTRSHIGTKSDVLSSFFETAVFKMNLKFPPLLYQKVQICLDCLPCSTSVVVLNDEHEYQEEGQLYGNLVDIEDALEGILKIVEEYEKESISLRSQLFGENIILPGQRICNVSEQATNNNNNTQMDDAKTSTKKLTARSFDNSMEASLQHVNQLTDELLRNDVQRSGVLSKDEWNDIFSTWRRSWNQNGQNCKDNDNNLDVLIENYSYKNNNMISYMNVVSLIYSQIFDIGCININSICGKNKDENSYYLDRTQIQNLYLYSQIGIPISKQHQWKTLDYGSLKNKLIFTNAKVDDMLRVIPPFFINHGDSRIKPDGSSCCISQSHKNYRDNSRKNQTRTELNTSNTEMDQTPHVTYVNNEKIPRQQVKTAIHINDLAYTGSTCNKYCANSNASSILKNAIKTDKASSFSSNVAAPPLVLKRKISSFITATQKEHYCASSDQLNAKEELKPCQAIVESIDEMFESMARTTTDSLKKTPYEKNLHHLTNIKTKGSFATNTVGSDLSNRRKKLRAKKEKLNSELQQQRIEKLEKDDKEQLTSLPNKEKIVKLKNTNQPPDIIANHYSCNIDTVKPTKQLQEKKTQQERHNRGNCLNAFQENLEDQQRQQQEEQHNLKKTIKTIILTIDDKEEMTTLQDHLEDQQRQHQEGQRNLETENTIPTIDIKEEMITLEDNLDNQQLKQQGGQHDLYIATIKNKILTIDRKVETILLQKPHQKQDVDQTATTKCQKEENQVGNSPDVSNLKQQPNKTVKSYKKRKSRLRSFYLNEEFIQAEQQQQKRLTFKSLNNREFLYDQNYNERKDSKVPSHQLQIQNKSSNTSGEQNKKYNIINDITTKIKCSLQQGKHSHEKDHEHYPTIIINQQIMMIIHDAATKIQNYVRRWMLLQCSTILQQPSPNRIWNNISYRNDDTANQNEVTKSFQLIHSNSKKQQEVKQQEIILCNNDGDDVYSYDSISGRSGTGTNISDGSDTYAGDQGYFDISLEEEGKNPLSQNNFNSASLPQHILREELANSKQFDDLLIVGLRNSFYQFSNNFNDIPSSGMLSYDSSGPMAKVNDIDNDIVTTLINSCTRENDSNNNDQDNCHICIYLVDSWDWEVYFDKKTKSCHFMPIQPRIILSMEEAPLQNYLVKVINLRELLRTTELYISQQRIVHLLCKINDNTACHKKQQQIIRSSKKQDHASSEEQEKKSDPSRNPKLRRSTAKLIFSLQLKKRHQLEKAIISTGILRPVTYKLTRKCRYDGT